jgi:hypothetical protein
LCSQNLPRIFALRDRLEQGERVSDEDIRYLRESFSDAMQSKPVFDRHPELAQVGAKIVTLYRDMSLKALDNERSLLA